MQLDRDLRRLGSIELDSGEKMNTFSVMLSAVLVSASVDAWCQDPVPNAPGQPLHELQIARLVYAAGPHASWGPGRAWWRIDWPEAEANFHGQRLFRKLISGL